MPDTFGTRLRLARRRRHLSIEHLARRADLSYAHCWRLEHDRHIPNLATAQRLADALGVPLSMLSPEQADRSSYPEDPGDFPAAS
jgi:transcriptional regulator with XRE-family HTH domain